MDELSYRRHRFPGIVIQYAVWLYFRFPLSYRDVEEMLAERGIDGTYETVRRWALKFGTIIARKLRRGRPRPDERWHLDEAFVSINGRQFYMWRAVDSEGEVLDILVQPRRDRRAALKLMRKLLKKQGISPATVVTDKLRSYSSALCGLGIVRRHENGRWRNNRAEILRKLKHVDILVHVSIADLEKQAFTRRTPSQAVTPRISKTILALGAPCGDRNWVDASLRPEGSGRYHFGGM